jgi:hypothetical protein
MTQSFPIRRASVYRQRAQQLTETAAQLRDDVDRKHLRDLAATFQRAADAMAPPEKSDGPQIQAPWRRDIRPGGA